MPTAMEELPVATTETTAILSGPDGRTDDPACCPPLGPRALSGDDAEELAGLLKALADPTRLRLLSLVATASAGEVCACDLPDAVDRSQSTVSHHLSQLVSAGLLQREQRGRWAWFRADHDVLADLSRALAGAGPT